MDEPLKTSVYMIHRKSISWVIGLLVFKHRTPLVMKLIVMLLSVFLYDMSFCSDFYVMTADAWSISVAVNPSWCIIVCYPVMMVSSPLIVISLMKQVKPPLHDESSSN